LAKERLMSDEQGQGIFESYEQGEDVPLASYAALAGVFNLIFALFLLLARVSGREIPERIKPEDIVLFGAATHKLSWIVTRDAITAPLRAPFTELEEVKSPTNVQEKPRDTGLQRSLGELLTCRFCLGMCLRPRAIPGHDAARRRHLLDAHRLRSPAPDLQGPDEPGLMPELYFRVRKLASSAATSMARTSS
jgi:hypothetical protein